MRIVSVALVVLASAVAGTVGTATLPARGVAADAATAPCSIEGGHVFVRGVDKGAITHTVAAGGAEVVLTGTPGPDVIAVTDESPANVAAGVTVNAGAGDDVVCSLASVSYLFGEAGDDLLAGAGDYNYFTGGPGADTFLGGPSLNNFEAGTGDADVIDGGVGKAMVSYRTAPVGVIVTLPDPETGVPGSAVAVGDGPDRADTLIRVNAVIGSEFADTLTGSGGADFMVGRGGDDRIVGRGGADTLQGGDGRDRIIGGAGNDVLRGGAGADLIKGGAGNDSIFGNRGRDRLLGGAGRDTLNGRKGLDTCIGGGGRDTTRSCERT